MQKVAVVVPTAIQVVAVGDDRRYHRSSRKHAGSIKMKSMHSTVHRWATGLSLFIVALALVAGVVGLVSPNARAAAWLVGQAAHGKFDEWRYRPTTVWRSDAWKRPSPKYRYAVMDHVVKRVVVPGMSQRDVARQLGPADHVRSDGAWVYEATMPGWSLIDFRLTGLVVAFDERQNVVRAEKYLWID